ncbi:MAG: tetratricopeptide repeat-containing glycosyltransferase family 2 protein [Thermacetogeniaceae bacterium]
MKPTIGLVMIVRDEEENLTACLESVRGVVDEIVIVDTGSRDRTVEIARRYTDCVYNYPWDDDFSAARNYAIERSSCDWLLSMDADEELGGSCGDLRTLVDEAGGYEAFFLPLYNQEAYYPGGYTVFPVLRLFRNLPDYRFQGKIHEQLIVKRPEAVGVAEHPVIWHKLSPPKKRNQKRGRNLALLRRAVLEEPDNCFLHYYLGVEWLGLGRPDLALSHLQNARSNLKEGHVLFRLPAVRSLVQCLKALKMVDEAICVCMEEAAKHPEWPDLFFEGGLLFEEIGEYEVAIRWFREATNCGCRHPLFSCTNGASGFLAFYHLGRCYERLGNFGEARQCYEKALSVNPEFVLPLCSLFLLELVDVGPDRAWEHLLAKGYMERPSHLEVLADLFFEAGCPDLASACLERMSPAGGRDSLARLKKVIKCRIYGGKADVALQDIERLQGADSLREGLEVDEIVALLLQGECERAKRRALSLWRRSRGAGWALLNLVALAGGGSICGYPEKTAYGEMFSALLAVIEGCLRFRSNAGGCEDSLAERYRGLALLAMQLLSRFSPEGSLALSEYLEKKSAAVSRLAAVRYGKVWGELA